MSQFPSVPTHPPGACAEHVHVAVPVPHVPTAAPVVVNVTQVSRIQPTPPLQQVLNAVTTVAKGTGYVPESSTTRSTRVVRAVAEISRELTEEPCHQRRQHQRRQRAAGTASQRVGTFPGAMGVARLASTTLVPVAEQQARPAGGKCWFDVNECSNEQVGRPLRFLFKVALTPPALACYGLGMERPFIQCVRKEGRCIDSRPPLISLSRW
eukprot:scaffold2779_cov376-Prasinococcus_capsulatus_cf.AAC.8